MPYDVEYLFGLPGSAGLAVSSSSSWCSPSSLLAGQCEKLKCPWLSVSTVLQQHKYQFSVNTVLVTNPKHNTIQDTTKEMISIPASPRTQVTQP